MHDMPEEAVKAAKDLLYYANPNDVERALTAALPFLSVQGAVKKLEWELVSGDHYAEGSGTHYNIYETRPDFWNCVTVKPVNVRLATNVSLEAAKAAAQADFEARILSALEPSAARELALEEGDLNARLKAKGMYSIDEMMGGLPLDKWRVHSGMTDLKFFGEWLERKAREYLIMKAAYDVGRKDEGDDLYEWVLAHYSAFHDVLVNFRAALSSPDHADAAPERAWYFKSGDTVPEWLEKIESGYCTLTFGVDVVVTSKDGGYEVRPQGIADNAGPILHVVNKGNVTPEIKGGGNGVAIIGYNRPYDETAEGKIERLKRLLEMARPYVECYDTREHNSEQDAVLTEIDKALSVLTEGDHIADAGKVEGDGNRETLWKSAARDFGAYLASNGTPYAIDYWNECFGPLFSAPSGGDRHGE